VKVETVAVGCSYACALLSPVLERIESEEGDPGDVLPGSVDSEDAAGLPGTRQHTHLLP
jgi:hypothetical protein